MNVVKRYIREDRPYATVEVLVGAEGVGLRTPAIEWVTNDARDFLRTANLVIYRDEHLRRWTFDWYATDSYMSYPVAIFFVGSVTLQTFLYKNGIEDPREITDRLWKEFLVADENYVITIGFFPKLNDEGLTVEHYDRDRLRIHWVPIEVTLGELFEICDIFQNHFGYTNDEIQLVMRS